jgi:hypothetical protein
VNNENRIKNLKKELDALRAKVDKEKAKMKAAQQKTSVDPARCLPVDISINSKFSLNVDEAAYALSIEIQVPPPPSLLLLSPHPLVSCPSIWLSCGRLCSST